MINQDADDILTFDKEELTVLALLTEQSKEEIAAALIAETASPGTGKNSFTMTTEDGVQRAKDKVRAEMQKEKKEADKKNATNLDDDKKIVPVVSCQENEYESTAATANSDRMCTALTVCQENEYESIAATANSDRVCTALTSCKDNQYESTTATAKSDRVCTEKQITAGAYHTCALLDNDTFKCWGLGSSGQLGHGDTTPIGGEDLSVAAAPAIDLGTDENDTKLTATQITAGAVHTCAILDNGTVKCWGKGDDGRLGHGDTTTIGDGKDEMGNDLMPIDLGTDENDTKLTATQITAGDNHTCALLNNNQVKCWGLGSSGQLGHRDTTPIGGADRPVAAASAIELGTDDENHTKLTATQITAGGNHTCALLNNNKIKCWGYGTYGQLGHRDTANIGDGKDENGDSKDEMGDNLEPIELGTDDENDTKLTATQITAGGNHTCALLNNGTVKCWGFGKEGRLGYGDTATIGDGKDENGNKLSENEDEMGDNLKPIELGTDDENNTKLTATQITAGAYHTCALLNNNKIKCWGWGYHGQLGHGDTTTIGDSSERSVAAASAIDLGDGKTATQITAGGSHTCALLNNNKIKCWGYGNYGQLGHGDTANIGDEQGEMGNSLGPIDLGDGKN